MKQRIVYLYDPLFFSYIRELTLQNNTYNLASAQNLFWNKYLARIKAVNLYRLSIMNITNENQVTYI